MATAKTKAKSAPAAKPDAPKETRLMVPIDSLRPDLANPRMHNARNLQDIMNSLDEDGQQHPIVVERGTNRVLAGNGRYEAAKRLGWSEIWVTYSDLEGARADRYALRDNRTGETSAWDYEMLSASLQRVNETGVSVATLGWEPFELQPLLADPEPAVLPSSKDEDDDEEAGEPGGALPESGVRMIQLYFTSETLPAFMELVNNLRVTFKTNNITETVVKGLEYAAANSSQADE